MTLKSEDLLFRPCQNICQPVRRSAQIQRSRQRPDRMLDDRLPGRLLRTRVKTGSDT
jgi:hypothetical protein